MHYELIETTSDSDFTHRTVELLTERINSAITTYEECIIGLSGGSTPRPIYEALGRQQIEWAKVSIFLIDERYVPADHKDSNQKLVRETLLANAHIPASNIVFPDCTLPLDECIRDYDGKLHALWNDHLTDINILGMGPDGHIASLFPSVAAHHLDDTSLVAHTTTDTFAVHDRITLTLNPICAAASQIFLLKGADKKQVWDEMIASKDDESRWPAKRVIETGEEVIVVLGA